MLRQSILAAIFLTILTISAHAATVNGKVLWIYDGDTIKVKGLGKVRLIGIDTPEYNASSRDNFYTKKYNIKAEQLRKISRLAKKYNLKHVKGKRVKLEFDRTKKDKYDRLLAYVFLPNGTMLNEKLLEKGLATVFRRYNFRHKKDFLRLEKKAKKKKLGIWQP